MDKFDKFRAAAARLFFDMINADGVIEDNEILLLEGWGDYVPTDNEGNPVDSPDFTKEANIIIQQGGLRKKYRIEQEHIQEAIKITTSQAIDILKRWQNEEEAEELKYNPKTVYLSENVKTDLMNISNCDGNRSIEEAKLLAAVSLCLNNRLSCEYRAIPITYRERNLRFAKREIIYLESEIDESVNADIVKNKPYLESLLALYGYDFVYIPDVVSFLRRKAETHILTPILMFSKPFYYKDMKKANDFSEELQKVSTTDFTSTFMSAAYLDESLPPCFLIKVKTSTIETIGEDNKPQLEKYTDFIALPVVGSVVESIRRLPENILEYTDNITSLVSMTLSEKLFCKGIHKTLIDYVVHRSSSNLVEKVVITLIGKEKYVEFKGVDGGKVAMAPKEIAIYLLLVILTSYKGGLPRKLDNEAQKDKINLMYSQVYGYASEKEDKDFLKTFSVLKSKIKGKIDKSLSHFEDRGEYNIDDTEDKTRVCINQDIVFVRDSYNDIETPLDEWIYTKKIKL